jgi:hypothetical protein
MEMKQRADVDRDRDRDSTPNPLLVPEGGGEAQGGEPALPPPVARAQARPAIGTMQEWLVRISAAGRELSPAELAAAGRAVGEGEQAISFTRRNGYKEMVFVWGGRSYEALMMAAWQDVWNYTAQHNSSSLAEDVPLLYLVLYVCFHRSTLRVIVWVAVYVILVVLVCSWRWQVADDVASQLLPSLIVLFCLGSMVRLTKGSAAAKTIRLDRSQLSLFTSHRKDDDDVEAGAGAVWAGAGADPPSVGAAASEALRLAMRYLHDLLVSGRRINNMSTQDYVVERKYKKDGTIGIQSYIELAENVGSYLHTVYSLDPENRQSRGFHPRVYSSYFMLFGLLFCLAYGVFSITYLWVEYGMYCTMFRIEDIGGSDDGDEQLHR